MSFLSAAHIGATTVVIGVSEAMGLAADPPVSFQEYIFQLGAAGLAIVVGFWLIRRYDARADKAAETAQKLLEAERAAHEVTRQHLLDCLEKRSNQ